MSTTAEMIALAMTHTAPSGETTVGSAKPKAAKLPISPNARPQSEAMKRSRMRHTHNVIHVIFKLFVSSHDRTIKLIIYKTTKKKIKK